MSDLTALLGRSLLSVLLLGGAAQKLLSPEGATALLALAGWPAWLIWPAIFYNAVAGLALLLGLFTRPVALSAAGYCIVTSYFHFLLGEDPWQITIAVKNWVIAGGYLMLAAHGPGRLSLPSLRK